MAQINLDKLLDKKKIISFYRERITGSLNELPPISVELHWTSNCNYECVHCSYGNRRKTTNFLNATIIEGLVDNLIELGCRAVYLSGGGEPTVIKDWCQYSKKLLDHGIEVALITNGVAISERHLHTVRRMNYVAVSVYSILESRYKRITQSNFFEGQFSLPKKIKVGATDTIVGARCVLNDINFEEVYLIYREAIESGFDYIIFIPAVDYEGRGVVLGNDNMAKVQSIIQEKMELFDSNRTNVHGLMSRGIRYYDKSDYRTYLPLPLSGCKPIQIRSGAFVNYDGGVYLCQPDIGNKGLEIGNLHDKAFIKMWNSKRHLEVINSLVYRYNEGSCKNCRSIAFNQAVYEEEAGLIDYEPELISDPFL